MKSAGDISRPFISISRSKPTSEWHDTYDEGYGLSSSRSVCPERIFSRKGAAVHWLRSSAPSYSVLCRLTQIGQ